MSWQTEVEQTVVGLGYVLVDAEQVMNGLLRIFIEHPNGEPAINVEDCERVTRQLQYVMEVAGIDYQRLEVSSPGLDRPLKRKEDFDRFLGALIEVVFKQPVEIQTGSKPYLQKKFVGKIEAAQDAEHDWVLILSDEPQDNKKKQGSKKKNEEPVMALGFRFSEVREAKLVPVVDFKRKKKKDAPDADVEA